MQDGYLIDIETGVIIALETDLRGEFHVTDEASAEWVLEKLLDCDVEIAKETMKLKAITERLQKNIKAKNSEKGWLLARFKPELEQYAKAQLEGGKAKSLKLAYGTLAFRTTKGGLRVKDPRAALVCAKLNKWVNAIKRTEVILIDSLTDDQREVAATYTEGFQVKPDEQKFDIQSGVNL